MDVYTASGSIVLTLSDHLRSIPPESLDSWWERVMTAVCQVETYGQGFFDAAKGVCEVFSW